MLLVVASLLTVAVAGSARANENPEIPAEEVQVSTPVYHPDSGLQFPLGTYNYTVSWQGIPAADASVSLEQTGLQYRVAATARTYSGIDLFYKLRYQAQGLVSVVDFSPLRSIFDQTENSRIRNTQIQFLGDGGVQAVRTQVGKETKVVNFKPTNNVYDPFSAALLARGLAWDLGKSAEFDCFNGKTRYLLTLTAVDKVKVTVNEVQKDVWVISPKVRKLTVQKDPGKLREAKIYMTADSSRDVLKIVSEVFIGSVTTKLDSFVPSVNPAPGASLVLAPEPVRMIF